MGCGGVVEPDKSPRSGIPDGLRELDILDHCRQWADRSVVLQEGQGPGSCLSVSLRRPGRAHQIEKRERPASILGLSDPLVLGLVWHIPTMAVRTDRWADLPSQPEPEVDAVVRGRRDQVEPRRLPVTAGSLRSHAVEALALDVEVPGGIGDLAVETVQAP